jgi:hypothetical protein
MITRFVLIGTLLVAAPACDRGARTEKALDVPAGSRVTVTQRDGVRVSGRLVDASSDRLVVQTSAGSTTIPRAAVAAVTATDLPTPAAGGDAGAAGAVATTGVEGSAERAGTMPAAGAARASAPEYDEITVPAGTVLPLVLESGVASDTSRAEQSVDAHVSRAVRVRGVEAIPAGSRVDGTVVDAARSGRVKGRARVALRFTTLRPRNADESYRIQTVLFARRAPGTKKQDAAKIAIPAAGGAIVGGIIGGKKGAAIGTAAGGGGGTAVVLSTRGKEVRIPRGTALSIRLLEPVTIRVRRNG